ncbi:hypothetical protein J4210_01205 [Candidatus Woesearchaeota archaeon]|nr:hypothetical protein [Candidatus Woesearchaeota archaeon]
MKKMAVVLGLMVLTLFVVACAPGETLAGQATSTGGQLVVKGDYFALPDGTGKLHLYQYQGADAPSKVNPKFILLKDIETGETIELEYLYQDYAGGIKGGALLKVGLYQAYAGGTDESKDYYLLLRAKQDSSLSDSMFSINFDPEGKEKLLLNAGKLKI